MVRLSACVITKNEEKNLPRWINSMQKIVDEMIVVDTGSTDQTRNIAEAAGAKVYDFVWCNDFAAAKNFAIEKASGDWILFLDADEYFTAETVENVPEYLFKVQDNKNIDAFLCRLVNINADEDDHVISVGANLRIFRNDEALRFQGQVHEFLVRLGGPLRLAHLEAKAEIYHTGYSTKIAKGKLERNLMILQEDIEKNGEKPWHYAYLADCYYGLKEYDKVIYYAKRSIEAKVIALGQETNIYRRLIDATVLGGKEEKKIMAVIELALGKFPRNPEFIWNKGEILFQQKEYVPAKKYLLKALHLYKNQKEKEQEGAFSGQVNLLYCTLGKVAVIEGDTLQALEYYTRSLMEYKYNRFALTGLYQLLRKQDPVDGIALLQSIYHTTKRDLEFVNKILKAYPMDKIYLYYTQILQNQYKISTEDVSIAGFLAAGKVDKAINCAMEKIKDIYMFIVMTVILSYDEQKYQTAIVLLPQAYRQVLNKFLKKNVKLTIEEYEIYNAVEHILVNTKWNMKVINSIDKEQDEQEQEKMIKLLRDFEKDTSVEKNEQKILQFCVETKIDMITVYNWIETEFKSKKTKVLVDIAVLFYKNNRMEESLRLMCRSYKKNMDDADIIYTFAFLLHLYGDDKGARKVIASVDDMTADFKNILQEMDDAANGE